MSKKRRNKENRYFTNKKDQGTLKRPKQEVLETEVIAIDIFTIDSIHNKNLVKNFIIDISYDDSISGEMLTSIFRIMRDLANFFGDKSIATLTKEELEEYLSTYINDGYGSIMHNLVVATVGMFYEFLTRNEMPTSMLNLREFYINYEIKPCAYPTFVFKDVLRQHNK